MLILQKWKFLKTSSTFLNTCLLIHVLLTSQISRDVVESGSKCVHVFCGLVDYGGITLLALRSPRAQKSIHIFDPDSTTRGGRRHWRVSGHFFSRMNSPMMPHTPDTGPAMANRFFAFAAAHTDREQHLKDWQNVCLMASENALGADFTTDDDVEWPLQEGNAESSLQIVV